MGKQNYTELGILIDRDPAEAAKQIREMLEQTNGNASEAARRFGIGHRTLTRYFAKLREAKLSVRKAGLKNQTALSALVEKDPEKAVAKIRAAIEKADGHETNAAKLLNVCHRTMTRCMTRLAEAGHPVT